MENSNNISKREVFCRYIRKKDGTVIYPKNARFFHFWVDDIPSDQKEDKQISMFENEQSN